MLCVLQLIDKKAREFIHIYFRIQSIKFPEVYKQIWKLFEEKKNKKIKIKTDFQIKAFYSHPNTLWRKKDLA